jgi:tRNA threonylcarbamoyladenosine biosynthesis protein TsaE
METITFDVSRLTDLVLATEAVLAQAVITAQKSDRAVVIALHGDLGAGKTTFVQTLARSLGIAETVTSPTFVIMKEYETTHATFAKLIHIDAYRIEDIDEMRPLGFFARLGELQTVICVEWAERIAELLPPTTISVTLTLETDETRILTISV